MVAVCGSICFRLDPSDDGFSALMNRTKGFEAKGNARMLPQSLDGKPFKLKVEIQQPENLPESPIRIDADFGDPYKVAISGFPIIARVSYRFFYYNVTQTSNLTVPILTI